MFWGSIFEVILWGILRETQKPNDFGWSETKYEWNAIVSCPNNKYIELILPLVNGKFVSMNVLDYYDFLKNYTYNIDPVNMKDKVYI